LFPDLRQEGRAPATGAEDHAVDVRAQLGEGVGLVAESHGSGGVSSETSTRVSGSSSALSGSKRGSRKAAAGVFLNVLEQRAPGFEAADAAAQVAVLGEGDEGGARFVQFRQVDRNRRAGQAEAGGDGVAGQRQQEGAEIRHRLLP
jgi:hypothetical protein